MDEIEFKTAHSSVNDLPCAFGKAVLRQCCGCQRSEKLFIAEREVIGCKSPGAQPRCKELLENLRKNAAFALKLTSIEGSLPHNKEVKVQCGGMLGLQTALYPGKSVYTRVNDIYALLDQAVEHFGSVAELPYTEIVKSVAGFQAREKRKK